MSAESRNIKIECDGETITESISDAPLTLVYKSPNMFDKDLQYPGRVKITPEMSYDHMMKVESLHDKTILLSYVVFRMEKVLNMGLETIKDGPYNLQKTVGMIDLALSLMDEGKDIVLAYPESGLHPSFCGNLGDLMFILSNYPNVDWYGIDPRYASQNDR